MRHLRWTNLAAVALAALALVWLVSELSNHTEVDRASNQLHVDGSESPASRTFDKSRRSTSSGSRPLRATSKPSRDRLLAALRRQMDDPNAIANEATLRFKSANAMREFLRRTGTGKVSIIGRLDSLNALRVRFGSLDQLRDALGDGVELSEEMLGPNYLVEVPRMPDPENRPEGAGTASFHGTDFLDAVGASGDRSTWGQGVTVAVIDTGVESHPTFGEGQLTHLDLVNDGQPFDGHGTAMASLIGGQDPQAPGIAPGAHILDVRVANGQGYSDSFTLATGIFRAVDGGAQVLNISLGSYGDAPLVRDAIAYAVQHGAVVIAAAGNDQTRNLVAYPAAIDSVVAVGAVDAQFQQAYFSNSGKALDLVAPGVGIQSAYGKNLIVRGDGTSQGTAITSGVAAFAISSRYTTAVRVPSWMRMNVTTLSLPPERGGAGMVRARK